MKAPWLMLALLPVMPLGVRGQGNTPQAALEELATTSKPEVVARHLPGPVEKSIEVLPKAAREKMLNEILNLKKLQLDGCTVRRNDDVDAWDIVGGDGKTQGRVKLSNAFISGVDAMLPLQIESDGDVQYFIVTMHLEGHEWRLDDFGPWEKADSGLAKLLHQPTEAEKNEAAAVETLRRLTSALSVYCQRFPAEGIPSSLSALTVVPAQAPPYWRQQLLDSSFAAEPLIKDGYQFRYTRTNVGDGTRERTGEYEITATPLEFGKTGNHNYFIDQTGRIHSTTQNRSATADDPPLSGEGRTVTYD